MFDANEERSITVDAFHYDRVSPDEPQQNIQVSLVTISEEDPYLQADLSARIFTKL